MTDNERGIPDDNQQPEPAAAPSPRAEQLTDRDAADPGTQAAAEEQPADTSGVAAEQAPGEPQSWQDVAPWQGKATPVDKLLLFGLMGVPLFYMVMLPFRPQLIASHPVLLEFLTGAKSAIVGAAAFARIGELPLTLVFIAGLIGMAKLDWMFWLAGRRWGDGAVDLFAQSDRQRKRFRQLKNVPTWLLLFFIFISRVPGFPGPIAWLVAGYSRMPLWLFLTAQIAGAAAMTAVWTALGYQLGQAAVDVIQVIDRYAVWISLALVIGIVGWSTAKTMRSEAKKAKAAEADATAEGTAEASAENEIQR